MSLATYGVLKCRALERKIDPQTDRLRRGVCQTLIYSPVEIGDG